MDFRQSTPFAKYLESSGWKTERLSDKTYVYIFPLPLIGSFIRVPRPKPTLPISELDQIAKKHRAILIKIEPNAVATPSVTLSGYSFDNWSIEPTQTLVINLTHAEQQLFSDLKPKWRQYVRLSKKNGVTTHPSDDIDTFVNLWQQNAHRKKIPLEKSSTLKVLWQEFTAKKRAHLLLAKVDNQPIAASFLIFSDHTCHLWHLAYSGDYPNLKPLYLLVWESILFAKHRGCKYFDFEGIEDQRLPYTKRVQPTFFKKGFGGRDVQFSLSYVKYTKPIYKPLFSLIAKISPTLFLPLYRIISKFRGFHQDLWSIEPTTTLIVDLNLTAENLFLNMKPDWRRSVRFAKKNNVQITKSDDIETFIKLWQKNAQRKGFLIEPADKIRILWQQLRKKNAANLLFAQIKKEVVAAVFLIKWQSKVHLWHVAYNGQFAKLQPLYLLIWEAILFAKSKGCQEFDFEGIEDQRLPYTKKIQSTYFKKGFGGRPVQYIGSYVKFLNPYLALPYYLLAKLKPDFFRSFYKKIYA